MHVEPAAQPEPAARPEPPPEPEQPPDLQPIDADGLAEQMRASRKRGTVVNVWASWCGSCKHEIPMLLQLRTAFAESGLEFVFVSADKPPDYAKAVELMRSWFAPLPTFVVKGSLGPFKQGMNPRWRGALPATFLFDEKAALRHFWEGPIREHEISPILQGFLAGDPIDGETRPPITGPAE